MTVSAFCFMGVNNDVESIVAADGRATGSDIIGDVAGQDMVDMHGGLEFIQVTIQTVGGQSRSDHHANRGAGDGVFINVTGGIVTGLARCLGAGSA